MNLKMLFKEEIKDENMGLKLENISKNNFKWVKSENKN